MKADSPSDLHCPVCGATDLRVVGPIYHPDPLNVAGVPINVEGLDFRLMRCRSCAFQFKFPQIPEERLLECYLQADSGHWGEEVDARHRNFDRVKAAIDRHSRGRKVLDVGCFTGAFLDYLGPQWERFGVEPSVAAAAVARQRGVQVLGATLADVAGQEQFDVIVAMDVLEHLIDPAPFFRRIGQLLRPGGIFVASTGDTAAWTWRLQGSRYWYCSYLVEHVSFYCQRTMSVLAAQSGMHSIAHERMSHKREPLGVQFHQALKGVTHALGSRLGWLGIPPLRRKFSRRAGTVWIASHDHMIHVMDRR